MNRQLRPSDRLGQQPLGIGQGVGERIAGTRQDASPLRLQLLGQNAVGFHDSGG